MDHERREEILHFLEQTLPAHSLCKEVVDFMSSATLPSIRFEPDGNIMYHIPVANESVPSSFPLPAELQEDTQTGGPTKADEDEDEDEDEADNAVDGGEGDRIQSSFLFRLFSNALRLHQVNIPLRSDQTS
eukprot:763379-Hanusia_phi.AAC.3